MVTDLTSSTVDDKTLVALKASGVYLDISQTATAASGVEGSGTNKVPGALEVITGAIDQVAGYKAAWGAGQNRLEYTVSNLMNVVEFTTAARSRIQDADFAQEAAKLAKAQVLQQTGAAMLAQANAAPQLALQLIK
jgi:flagellin